jgi:ferredoxin/flavodoxin---NADP+ reductase
MIFGGGDSAVDWVLNLLDTASELSLVHRRQAFRAHELTVGQMLQAADGGDLVLHVPFQIQEVRGNGKIESVVLHNSADPAQARSSSTR